MTAPSAPAAIDDAVPATEAWCVVCRTWRPYAAEAIPPASFKFKPGFTADTLKCQGCATSLLAVRAPTPVDERGEP